MTTLERIQKILRGVNITIGPDDDLARAIGERRDQYEVVSTLLDEIEREFNVDVAIDEISLDNFATPRLASALVDRLRS